MTSRARSGFSFSARSPTASGWYGSPASPRRGPSALQERQPGERHALFATFRAKTEPGGGAHRKELFCGRENVAGGLGGSSVEFIAASRVSILVLASCAAGWAQTADAGSAVYGKHCAQCHDKGVGRAPQLLVLSLSTPEQVLAALTTGKMVDQGKALTPTEKRARWPCSSPAASLSARRSAQGRQLCRACAGFR